MVVVGLVERGLLASLLPDQVWYLLLYPGVELGTPLEGPPGHLRVLSEDRFFRTFLPGAELPPSLS